MNPCARCKRRPRHVSASGRVYSYCATCKREKMRAWQEVHPDAWRRYGRARRQRDPAKHREKQRAWRRANGEKVRAYNARYEAAHPEKVRAWKRKWTQRNPGARAEAAAARRARKTGQFVERVYRSRVFKRDAGFCGICGGSVEPTDFQLDHRIPLCAGGEHSYANIQLAHPLCNARKGGAERKAASHAKSAGKKAAKAA